MTKSNTEPHDADGEEIPVALHSVVARLKDAPRAFVSRDLAPDILARIRRERARRRRMTTLMAAAATVALLVGAGLWFSVRGDRASLVAEAAPADPARKAVAWLCATQEPDGSWSTVRWGGDKHFEPALTALSLMTLLGDPEGGAAADKATVWLLGRQQPDGTFGDTFSGSPYNQGMVVLALSRAYETRKSETLRVALDRAVAAICTKQYADGGWGYHNEAHPASNLSITLWQIEALRQAVAQGRPQLQVSVEKGLRWMAGVAADDGSFGYQKSGDTPGGASQTLTAMGAMSLLDGAHAGLLSGGRRQAIVAQMRRSASNPGADMDYYRRYFLTAALKRMGEESAHRDLGLIRNDLLARQVTKGPEAGSWTADTRWGSAGGRIYATTLASLSLR